jgi:CheY-like chemotaxis protein
MDNFDAFAHDLREALTHLYDPIYQPTPLLRRVLVQQDANQRDAYPEGSVQQLVIAAIQRHKPGPDVPPSARSRRLYDLLACRYVQELTQEETAERLGITPRHLRREQQQAVQMLAQWLWEQQTAPGLSLPEPASGSTGQTWRAQVQQELAVLETSEPGAVADVADIVAQVVRLERGLAANHGCRLIPCAAELGLLARLHPSVLRQLLIVAVQKLVRVAPGGEVSFGVWEEGDALRIEVTGAPVAAEVAPVSEFIVEAAGTRGGQADVFRAGEQVSFRICLPRAQPLTILVADDNADIIHTYRRYTERTRFRIVHAVGGQQALELAHQLRPAAIVLDVMLPDMDGWEVLTRLHENLETRETPVIVCSVVRQEELAQALGATLYLPKPVRRQELIQALERLLAPDSAAVPPG